MHDVRPENSVSSVGLRQKSHARNISQRSMAGSMAGSNVNIKFNISF